MAVDDSLVKLAQMFAKQKQQTVFLINNYDMIISVLKVRSYYIFLFFDQQDMSHEKLNKFIWVMLMY